MAAAWPGKAPAGLEAAAVRYGSGRAPVRPLHTYTCMQPQCYAVSAQGTEYLTGAQKTSVYPHTQHTHAATGCCVVNVKGSESCRQRAFRAASVEGHKPCGPPAACRQAMDEQERCQSTASQAVGIFQRKGRRTQTWCVRKQGDAASRQQRCPASIRRETNTEWWHQWTLHTSLPAEAT
eukprot:scaffold102125_cov18-Tisochrysis_lutea.AAC.1